jgi:serine/threonine protein kinase
MKCSQTKTASDPSSVDAREMVSISRVLKFTEVEKINDRVRNTVYLASDNEKKYIVKRIFTDKKNNEEFFLKKLHHPNIIRLLKSSEDEENKKCLSLSSLSLDPLTEIVILTDF